MCPIPYQSRQQLVLPIYVTFSVEAEEQIWSPNSDVASHMTLEDGKLLSNKSIYFGMSLVKVGNLSANQTYWS